MADFTEKLPEAAQNYLKGKRLDEVECIISDLPGIARGKAVPGQQIRQAGLFPPAGSASSYQTITGDWGEAADEERALSSAT